MSGWVNGKNVWDLYEFAGTCLLFQGSTAREADSLPYRGRVVVLQFILYLISHILIKETLIRLLYQQKITQHGDAQDDAVHTEGGEGMAAYVGH